MRVVLVARNSGKLFQKLLLSFVFNYDSIYIGAYPGEANEQDERSDN